MGATSTCTSASRASGASTSTPSPTAIFSTSACASSTTTVTSSTPTATSGTTPAGPNHGRHDLVVQPQRPLPRLHVGRRPRRLLLALLELPRPALPRPVHLPGRHPGPPLPPALRHQGGCQRRQLLPPSLRAQGLRGINLSPKRFRSATHHRRR